MSFYQRYELERLIADGETKTFRAVENATGRSVLFHFFNPEGQPILAALKSKLGKVPGKPQFPLLELGEFAGSPYAVMAANPQFTTLREWVDSIDGDAPPAADQVTKLFEARQPPPVPDARYVQPVEFTATKASPIPDAQLPTMQLPIVRPPIKPPGEFTRFFGSAPEPPQPRGSEPGEFTRWFDAPPAASSKPTPAVPRQLDTFEQLFGGIGEPAVPQPTPLPANSKPSWPASEPATPPPPPAIPKPSWPARAASDPGTGQFTRLFGSGPSGESINIEEEQARAARARQPESRPFQPPSEFTRMFGPEVGGSSPPPPPRTKIGSASGLFGSIALKTAVPSKPTGPGEYTRITSRSELEAEQAARDKAQAAAPAPAAARRGFVIALAIGGGLLVVTIIVILVLTLQKH